MPAAYWWNPGLGSDLLANTVTNWMKGPSIPYAYYQSGENAPGQYDDLYFRGDLSSANCTLPAVTVTSQVNTFASVHIQFGEVTLWETTAPPIGSPPAPPSPPTPVTILQAYSGEVITQSDLAVGTLDIECGAIRQNALTSGGTPGPGGGNSTGTDAGTFTINSFLDWTGGTLNSNTVAGTIALAPGATGVAEPSFTNPGINGTVGLGSVLTLKGNNSALGSTLDALEGTFKLLNNDASFVVENNSLITFKAPANPNATTPGKITIDSESKTGPVKEALTIKEGGKGLVKAKDRTGANIAPAKLEFTGKGSSLRNSGELVIKDLAWVIFDEADEEKLGGLIQNPGDAPLDPDGPPPALNQVTQIESGCRITCKGLSAVTISTGSLVMNASTTVGALPTIDIQGSLTGSTPYTLWIAAQGKIETPGDRTVPLQLRIDGRLQWTGEIQLYADHTKYKNDQVLVDGQIIVEKDPPPDLLNPPLVVGPVRDPKLTVKWFDAANGQPVSTVGAWNLVESTYTIPEGTQGPPLPHFTNIPKFVAPPDVGNSRATIGMNPDGSRIEMKLGPA